MKRILILLSVLVINGCQEKRNNNLKQKLESILLRDQGVRELTNSSISSERRTELLSKLNITEEDLKGNGIYRLINHYDSINLIEVEKITKEYGYPSKSVVGEPANKAVFYVIQHSKKIDKYLPLIRKAVEQGDVDRTSLAMMEDRNLMYRGLEQIYGTQIKGKANKKGEWIYFLWPLKNSDSVNVWREGIGFEQTVEEYVIEMDIEYNLYKLEDLDKL